MPREVRFGSYILGLTLGEGEFAKVKLGWRKDGKQPSQVAIKLIKRDLIPRGSERESKVHREINALKKLSHPNIVRLEEVLQNDKYVGIVLDYASGGELFDYIFRHKHLKDQMALKLFAQLVSGVDYMHSKHIVHRDLKLENLLLDKHKNIVILDFGFVNSFLPGNELMKTLCGLPCYAAPELVLKSEPYEARKVDVWSCGVILYAMLAGYLPFDDDPDNPEGTNISKLYNYISTTELTFPEYVQPLPRNLLRNILVPEPKRRYLLKQVRQHLWLAQHALFLLVTPEEWDRSVRPAHAGGSGSAASGAGSLGVGGVARQGSRRNRYLMVEGPSLLFAGLRVPRGVPNSGATYGVGSITATSPLSQLSQIPLSNSSGIAARSTALPTDRRSFYELEGPEHRGAKLPVSKPRPMLYHPGEYQNSGGLDFGFLGPKKVEETPVEAREPREVREVREVKEVREVRDTPHISERRATPPTRKSASGKAPGAPRVVETASSASRTPKLPNSGRHRLSLTPQQQQRVGSAPVSFPLNAVVEGIFQGQGPTTAAVSGTVSPGIITNGIPPSPKRASRYGGLLDGKAGLPRLQLARIQSSGSTSTTSSSKKRFSIFGSFLGFGSVEESFTTPEKSYHRQSKSVSFGRRLSVLTSDAKEATKENAGGSGGSAKRVIDFFRKRR